MPLVATLVANPSNPVLGVDIGAAAGRAAGAAEPDWLADGVACDLQLPDGADADATRAALEAVLGDLPVDIVIRPATDRRKTILLADMDSTMIEQECIDELAAEIGIKDRVADITRRAMNGEMEFEAALKERVALLKGLDKSAIDSVLENRITLAPGGRELVATMKAHGGYTALVSGGFTAFTGRVAAMLGFDENSANILLESGGVLTGEVAEPILGRQAKVDTLMALADRLKLTPQEVIAVGDGANDLGMLGLAGSGVALHAKPAVAAQCDIRIDHGDLTALLYIQGYRQTDFAAP